MNISGPAAVAKPEMLFYAPGDLTVTIILLDLCRLRRLYRIFFLCCNMLNGFLYKYQINSNNNCRMSQSKRMFDVYITRKKAIYM